jgi:hypothetical protein
VCPIQLCPWDNCSIDTCTIDLWISGGNGRIKPLAYKEAE